MVFQSGERENENFNFFILKIHIKKTCCSTMLMMIMIMADEHHHQHYNDNKKDELLSQVFWWWVFLFFGWKTYFIFKNQNDNDDFRSQQTYAMACTLIIFFIYDAIYWFGDWPGIILRNSKQKFKWNQIYGKFPKKRLRAINLKEKTMMIIYS